MKIYKLRFKAVGLIEADNDEDAQILAEEYIERIQRVFNLQEVSVKNILKESS